MENNKDTNQFKQEYAYNAIKDSIVKEEYAPNQMISTRALCAKLGVSRTPVIEALKKLSYEGFVELIPNRGVTVTSIRPRDLLEIYQLREGVEGVAARMCTLNHPEDIIRQMEQCLQESEEAFRNGQYGKAISLDNRFHTLLITGSGNDKMLQITEALLHQSGRGNFLQATASERMKRSAVQHRNILKAIKKRDPDSAEKYAREHMHDVQSFVLS
ncbi:MAG: GntR family transcriptional regulator, partial [Clostridiales Family XIII bacterium]|nr:GntR family transcriptional regulator [Clostridiales Family XIII bacterium]